jgi:hypothetical protein
VSQAFYTEVEESVLMFRTLSATGAIFLLASLSGCGYGVKDPYPRVSYSGTVTLDGSPLKSGFLYLEPLERQPTQSYAVIQDGKFEVTRSAGAVPGRYRVSIVRDESFELPEGIDQQTPEGAAVADSLSKTAPVKPLHPLYNVKSTLSAELAFDSVNHFLFDLKTDPEPPVQ